MNDLKDLLAIRSGAVAYVQRLRREALGSKRACGQPRNPFKAVPGMEKEFEEASNAARYCDFILKEIEKKQERAQQVKRVKLFASSASNRFFDYMVALGLLSLAGAGLVFAGLVIKVVFDMKPLFVIPTLFGVVAAVAVIAEIRARRSSRK